MIINTVLSALSPVKPQTQQQKTNQAYAQYAGTRMAASGSYISNKSPLEKITDDFLMDIGSKQKDADYYARLAARNKSSKDAMNALIATNSNKDYASPADVPREPTAEELYAAQKAAELQQRKTEGQASRKEYEQKKGALVLAQRKKYTTMLNVS